MNGLRSDDRRSLPYPPQIPEEVLGQPCYDELTTRFLDEWLLGLAAKEETPADPKEFRQIVLVGSGYDTRPFRLPWPTGTVLYLVASPESHEMAEALLSVHGSDCKVPEGCLLRRVNANLRAGAPFSEALTRAGYRPDRLSAWGLQGLVAQGLDLAAWRGLLQEVDGMAAFESIVLGELPEAPARDQEDLLAEHGLLGAPIDYAPLGRSYGRWEDSWPAAREGEGPRSLPARAFFKAEHKRPSLEQTGVYTSFRAAMEDVDEDYTDNIS